MSSASFTQTRNTAISLENQTQGLLGRYLKYQQSTSVEPDAEELSLVAQISDMLVKRDEVLARLSRASDADPNILTSKLQQLQRHKEVLQGDHQLFSKMQTRIQDERNRNNLLFLVQLDILAHKQRNVSLAAENANDYILEESRRIDLANNFAERLLQLAYDTRDELISQRAYLQNAQGRITNALLSIPGINVLVSRINTRRKRDTLILGLVISFCIIGLFFFA